MSIITNYKNKTKELMRLQVITDPNDPNIKNFYNELIEYNIIISTEKLNRGLIKHDIMFDPEYLSSNKIQRLIKNINYDPISISMKIKLGDEYIIENVRDIIKALSNKILNEHVVSVEYTKYINPTDDKKYIIIFTPISKTNNSPIYENSLYLNEYYKIINTDLLSNYKLLSEDSLVNYSLNKLYKNNEYIFSDIEPVSIKNIMLYPKNKSNNVRDDVDFIIESKRAKGYFTYKIGVHNYDDIYFIKELAMLWNTKIVAEYKNNIVLKLENGVDLGLKPSIWFKKNVNIIKNGQFPKITLSGSWQYHNDSYSQIHDKVWYKSILQYAGILAYKKLSETEDFIRPFIYTVEINNDYSVSLSVPTYNHTILFKKYMTEIMDTYRLENTILEWTVEPFGNLKTAIIKRWYVQNMDDKSYPMILSHDNEDTKHNTNILIYRTGIYKHNHPNEINLNKINIKNIKNTMVNEFQKYYKSDYSLEEIMDIVEINKVSENVINEKSIYLDWGLRGLFDIGPMKGLYKDIPSKILIKPKIGKPIFNVVDENVVSISIYFEDNDKLILSPLFDIKTKNNKELVKVINKLWYEGYFLNYWTSAVQKYKNDVKGYVINTNNNILLNAGNSYKDGEIALNYLINMTK